MKSFHIAVAIAGLALIAGKTARAQDGMDINTAIPIYFSQVINDTIDSSTRIRQVYSINLAKGQQVSVTANSNGLFDIYLLSPASKSVSTSTTLVSNGVVNSQHVQNYTLTYQVSVAGTYFINIVAQARGTAYKLQVQAQGTPIAVPNPATAGCVTGQVDYLTYSLQLIAAGLPDEASIGGSKLCASCTVKPPAYKEIVDKMESAMGMNVGVSACYDTSGNIFLLKLLHP